MRSVTAGCLQLSALVTWGDRVVSSYNPSTGRNARLLANTHKSLKMAILDVKDLVSKDKKYSSEELTAARSFSDPVITMWNTDTWKPIASCSELGGNSCPFALDVACSLFIIIAIFPLLFVHLLDIHLLVDCARYLLEWLIALVDGSRRSRRLCVFLGGVRRHARERLC